MKKYKDMTLHEVFSDDICFGALIYILFHIFMISLFLFFMLKNETTNGILVFIAIQVRHIMESVE